MQVSEAAVELESPSVKATDISGDSGPLFKLLFEDLFLEKNSKFSANQTHSTSSLYQHTTDLGSIEHFLIFNHLPYVARGSRRVRAYQRDL